MKKTLEELIKPIKYVDEQVLRQYTKLAKKVEARRISKYKLASYLNITAAGFSIPASILGFLSAISSKRSAYGGGGALCVFTNMIYATGINKEMERAEKLEMVYGVKDSCIESLRWCDRVLRLPMLLTGIYFLGDGIIDIYRSLKGGNIAINDAITQSSYLLNILLYASAQYIRDTDPKLLQKEPLWKKAYNWCKEKAGSLVPQPVPVRAYSTLEDYI